ncbi:hypothetical protein [Fusibacter sp. 3D3]|uniref:hypothetical protein n=1 Tax=Fusibacter sp. 3D3 TaxID=1048380 RepID=UPI000853BCC9|nr:hypothetical protein [Fusibacter sp. 3D3]GAU77766.1 hypothetical protein F3D3_2395 [Fusibacter sp. 3D3]
MRYTIEDKVRFLQEQKASGLIATEWCQKNQVPYGSFKNFSKSIRDYNFPTNPAQKAKQQKKKVPKVAWISAQEESPQTSQTDSMPVDPSQEKPAPKLDYYTIEIGIFKVHIPTTIHASSLRTLMEVLKICS